MELSLEPLLLALRIKELSDEDLAISIAGHPVEGSRSLELKIHPEMKTIHCTFDGLETVAFGLERILDLGSYSEDVALLQQYYERIFSFLTKEKQEADESHFSMTDVRNSSEAIPEGIGRAIFRGISKVRARFVLFTGGYYSNYLEMLEFHQELMTYRAHYERVHSEIFNFAGQFYEVLQTAEPDNTDITKCKLLSEQLSRVHVAIKNHCLSRCSDSNIIEKILYPGRKKKPDPQYVQFFPLNTTES